MDTILTVSEVAKLIKVKPITVREMFRGKRLRGFKVGKAWRTTEKMLQEDIEALANGRSPAELDQPEAAAKPAVKEAAPAKAPKKKAPKKRQPARDTSHAEVPQEKAPEEEAPEEEAPGEEASEEDNDDSQQLLF